MKYCHNKELTHVNSIWRKEICPITEKVEEKKLEDGTIVRKLMSRVKLKKLVEPIILKHIDDYQKAMADVLSNA